MSTRIAVIVLVLAAAGCSGDPAPQASSSTAVSPAAVEDRIPMAATTTPSTSTTTPPSTSTTLPSTSTTLPSTSTTLPSTSTTTPPSTSTPGRACDPNYSDCVPIASDVDCAGGTGNGPAYAQGPINVIGTDIYNLDSDSDGVACN